MFFVLGYYFVSLTVGKQVQDATQGVFMLILTRRIGQRIFIGDDVELLVVGVKGNQVKLGVAAPKDIAVHREEIYERIQKEKAKR